MLSECELDVEELEVLLYSELHYSKSEENDTLTNTSCEVQKEPETEEMRRPRNRYFKDVQAPGRQFPPRDQIRNQNTAQIRKSPNCWDDPEPSRRPTPWDNSSPGPTQSPRKHPRIQMVQGQVKGIDLRNVLSQKKGSDVRVAQSNQGGKMDLRTILSTRKSGEFVKPVQPAHPIQPFIPVQPVRPFQTVQPLKPVQPVQPVQQLQPVQHVQPFIPFQHQMQVNNHLSDPQIVLHQIIPFSPTFVRFLTGQQIPQNNNEQKSLSQREKRLENRRRRAEKRKAKRKQKASEREVVNEHQDPADRISSNTHIRFPDAKTDKDSCASVDTVETDEDACVEVKRVVPFVSLSDSDNGGDDEVIFIENPPVEIIDLDEDSQEPGNDAGTAEASDQGEPKDADESTADGSSADGSSVVPAQEESQSDLEGQEYNPEECRDEVLGTPEENDFIEHSGADLSQPDYYGIYGVDFNSEAFSKPSQPYVGGDGESESTSSTHVDLVALKSGVFNEPEFPKEGLFEDENLENFGNFITPTRSGTAVNDSETPKRSGQKKKPGKASNSTGTNIETESEVSSPKKARLSAKFKNLPTLSPIETERTKVPKKSKKVTATPEESAETVVAKKSKKKKSNQEPEQLTDFIDAVVTEKKKKKIKKKKKNRHLNNQVEEEPEVTIPTDETPKKSSKSRKYSKECESVIEEVEEATTAPPENNNPENVETPSQPVVKSELPAEDKQLPGTSHREEDSQNIDHPKITPDSNSNALVDENKAAPEANCSSGTTEESSSQNFAHSSEPTTVLKMETSSPPRKNHNRNSPETEPLDGFDIIDETFASEADTAAAAIIVVSDSDQDDVALELHAQPSDEELSDLDGEPDIQLINCTQLSPPPSTSPNVAPPAERTLEHCSVQDLQSSMSDDPKLWRVLESDRLRFRTGGRGKRCNNCRQFGHCYNECPEKPYPPKCWLCGRSGHYESRCPNKLCTGCGEKQSHMSSYCNICFHYRYKQCEICWMTGHIADICPDLWRRYHLTTTEGPLVEYRGQLCNKSYDQLWCSNCARSGHLEHSCKFLSAVQYPKADPFIRSYTDIYAEEPYTDAVNPEAYDNSSVYQSDVPAVIQDNNPYQPTTFYNGNYANYGNQLTAAQIPNFYQPPQATAAYVNNQMTPKASQPNAVGLLEPFQQMAPGNSTIAADPMMAPPSDDVRFQSNLPNYVTLDKNQPQDCRFNFQNPVPPRPLFVPEGKAVTMKDINRVFFTMRTREIQQFLATEFQQMAKLSNNLKGVVRDLRRNLTFSEKSCFKACNIVLFGIYHLEDGRKHFDHLKEFKRAHPMTRLSKKCREQLYNSYCYIFGAARHQTNYRDLLYNVV